MKQCEEVKECGTCKNCVPHIPSGPRVYVCIRSYNFVNSNESCKDWEDNIEKRVVNKSW